MAMNLLEDWCRGMEVDIHRALLVTGIPKDCGQDEIEETLSGVLTPLGPYRVLNKIFLREENAKAVLIEVGEGVSLRAIPREFPGRGGVWRVVCRGPTQDAEFLKNLNEFLEAEARTREDVMHLLQLNHPEPPQDQNQPPENWGEALGMLLGALVQILFYLDAEVRRREEVRAQEAAEAGVFATAASAVGSKVKEGTGCTTEGGAALKKEKPDSWRVEGEGDPPKPLVRRAGAKICFRRKQNPKQEPVPWKKPKGSRLTARPRGRSGRLMMPQTWNSEDGRGDKKPDVKQEALTSKKPVAKGTWMAPCSPPGHPGREAQRPGVPSEPDQGGGQEGPPKKKGMGCASTESPASTRKKKKVRLGPSPMCRLGRQQETSCDSKKGRVPDGMPLFRRLMWPAESPSSVSLGLGRPNQRALLRPQLVRVTTEVNWVVPPSGDGGGAGAAVGDRGTQGGGGPGGQ